MIHDLHPILARIVNSAHIKEANYRADYQRSMKDPVHFWGEAAHEHLTWIKPWDQVLSGDFELGNMKWFEGGQINAAYNCLDRHLPKLANQVALIWESDNPNLNQTLTYQMLYERVCGFANVLKRHGIKKGDRVCIYLPMVPEVAIAMLACVRIGAIHSVVFAGFSAESLAIRIKDTGAHLVITANEGVRGNKILELKKEVDRALESCHTVKTVIVVRRTEAEPQWWDATRDHWYHNEMIQAQNECQIETMEANDPLFILYTSGSTGKPKGILHGTGGYLLYVAMTFKLVFDYHAHEVHWCTADVGWITGHSYSIYGPLLNGATTVLFEGVPYFPTPSRYWDIIDKHKVNIFYTAPTALRALRREGDEWLSQTNRNSLRILGTVGEAINPEVWEWYYHKVGNAQCSIVDTWWQTETGGVMIAPLPGATPLKPGSAAWPFFGVAAQIVDELGEESPPGKMGKLIIKKPWPGMMQSIYGDHDRFIDTYLKPYPGAYLTGDQAFQDQDGYFWLLGRDDDVIKVSGHRIGSQEVESALLNHLSVSEAAVVPVPDAVKGYQIYAYITLKKGIKPTDTLREEIIQMVRKIIGPLAQPKYIQWAEGLPKTRSGKIMRRLLRKIANQETQDLGDLTTLADPNVIHQLIKDRKVILNEHE